MSDLSLLAAGHPRLEPSVRVGDAWAAVAGIGDPTFRHEREQVRALLAERPRPLERTERPGHLTGSALVVDAAAHRTLVLFHTKLQIWVQPGGHADGDANLAAVALREAEEETGLAGLRVWPAAIDLDIHRVDPPAEDAHDHYDVRFLVIAPSGAEFSGNEESQALRWVELGELPSLGVDPGIIRMATTGLCLARSSEVARDMA